jgi:hypothetical protein
MKKGTKVKARERSKDTKGGCNIKIVKVKTRKGNEKEIC